MWTPHPDNRLPGAWDELVERTGEMVRQAAASGVTRDRHRRRREE